MRISIGTIVLLGSLCMSGVATAQDTGTVAAEKQAPIKSILPGAYANLEVRHASLRSFNDDQTIHNDSVGLFVIPKIGTTLFNDKVDTSFTYKFEKRASSDTVIKYDAYNETQWNVVDGKFNDKSPYNFGPYALTDIMTQGTENWQYADIGFFGSANYEFNVGTSGSIALLSYLNPMVQVLSNQAANTYDRVPAANNTNKGADQLGGYGLSTASDGSTQGVQKDDTYILDYGIGAKYKPAAIAGLSVGFGLDIMQYWQPVYAFNNVNGVPTQQRDHYSNQALTMNRFILGYQISDKVSLSEQLREFNGGYDQRSVTLGNPDYTGNVGPYRWENRLALTATLL